MHGVHQTYGMQTEPPGAVPCTTAQENTCIPQGACGPRCASGAELGQSATLHGRTDLLVQLDNGWVIHCVHTCRTSTARSSPPSTHHTTSPSHPPHPTLTFPTSHHFTLHTPHYLHPLHTPPPLPPHTTSPPSTHLPSQHHPPSQTCLQKCVPLFNEAGDLRVACRLRAAQAGRCGGRGCTTFLCWGVGLACHLL